MAAGALRVDSMTAMRLFWGPQSPEAVVLPQGKKTQNVMFLCCNNKGELTIEAQLAKNFYCIILIRFIYNIIVREFDLL